MIWNTCLSMSLAVEATCSIIMLLCRKYRTITQPRAKKDKSARRNLVHGAKIDCQCFS